MSIAGKLNYLITTKGLLKDNINKINNVLTDNSTFRSYPQELFNGYLDILNNGTDTLWNNLEKVSQTGTEPVLENVETAPLKMVLNGNTSQDTTTGKNLFDKSLFQNFTDAIKFISLNLKPNTQYTVSSDIPSSYNSANLFALNSTGNPSTTTNGVSPSVPRTVTTLDDGILRIGYRDNGNALEDEKNNYWYQVEKGSTATSYEPYTNGASPNPDYPQEVKVVKGENVVSVQGKNLISSLGKVGNTIYFNGYNNQEVYPFKAGTYTISYKNSNSATLYLKEKNSSIINKGTSKTITFTTSEDFNVWFYRSGITTEEFVEIQLEEGSTASEYTPFSKTDYPLSLGTLELCKINTYKDYFHKDNGKWYVHKAIEKMVLDGTEGGWNLNYTSTQKNIIRYAIDNLLAPDIKKSNDEKLVISNYFKGVSSNETNSNVASEPCISGRNARGLHICVYLNDSNMNTLELFKTWLSTHNTIVYYVLATPTEEEITNSTLIEQLEAISKAKSVKDKTYITQTNDELSFILDVEAIKEYEVN